MRQILKQVIGLLNPPVGYEPPAEVREMERIEREERALVWHVLEPGDRWAECTPPMPHRDVFVVFVGGRQRIVARWQLCLLPRARN